MKNNMKFMYGLIALFILAGISYAATTITGSGITTEALTSDGLEVGSSNVDNNVTIYTGTNGILKAARTSTQYLSLYGDSTGNYIQGSSGKILKIGTDDTSSVYVEDSTEVYGDLNIKNGATVLLKVNTTNTYVKDKLGVGVVSPLSKLHLEQNENSEAVIITNNGNEHGVVISQDGVLGSRAGLRIYSNAIQTDGNANLLNIKMDNAASSSHAVNIIMDGTGRNLILTQNGANFALDIASLSSTSSAIRIQDMASNKSVQIEENDKICFDGGTCNHYLTYNGSCILSSSGSCV